jgi:hypothetical protein
MDVSTFVDFECAHCGTPGKRQASYVNRSKKTGMALYCNRVCAGAAHKIDTRTPEQKKADKSTYDREYREKNRDLLKAKKHRWFRKVYDPERARIERASKMPRHVEYCRQPEYKSKKAEYDKSRTDKQYGEYAEAARLLMELKREIIKRVPDKYERQKGRGYIERQIQRQTERRRNGKAQQIAGS